MTPAPSVIFDLDGTLIDSVPDLHAAVNRLLHALDAAPMSRAEVTSFVGNGAPALVRRVMEARDISAERHSELTTRLVEDYTRHSAELTTIYPNVCATLQLLVASGHPLAICTNKPTHATGPVLSALGLAGFFPIVIAGDTLPEKKPHPAPLLAARDALGARNCLYVGDSEVDAACAVAAGLPFALFSEGYLRVPVAEVRYDAVFADFAELPGILGDLFSD